MLINWRGRDGLGRVGFNAVPGQYDAVPPIESLLVDRDLSLITDDVLSLSGFLAFLPYCSGSTTLPRKVSPELAQAMEASMSPAWSQISPVEFEPRAAPVGDGFLFVDSEFTAPAPLPNIWGMPRNMSVSVLDAAEWAGSILSMDSLAVASNAAILSKCAPSSLAFTPYLAVALLYMESYRCGTLVVPDDVLSDDDAWQRVKQLVSACKFSLLRLSEAKGMLFV